MNNTTRNSATPLASFFPHAIEALPFHGWASVVLRAVRVFTYFACAHRGSTHITLAHETTSPAGKEVEAVAELTLLEKPKHSKLITTQYSWRAVRIIMGNAMEPLPACRSPPPFLARAHDLDLRGRRRGRPFGACDEKTSRLMRHFTRHGDLATANFPHCMSL